MDFVLILLSLEMVLSNSITTFISFSALIVLILLSLEMVLMALTKCQDLKNTKS